MFSRDEVLTDNTKIKYCTQCEKCIRWGNDKNDYRSNKFSKECCDKYPFPDVKPQYVIDNTGKCIYRKEKKNG